MAIHAELVAGMFGLLGGGVATAFGYMKWRKEHALERSRVKPGSSEPAVGRTEADLNPEG